MANKVQSFTLTSTDGIDVFVRYWVPSKSTRGVLIIAHGAAEHGLRYARVAEVLVDAGFEVYAPDHRGHGKTALTLERAGNAGVDGFNGILRDLAQLITFVRSNHGRAPLFVMGHSMGAALVQRLIQLLDFNLSGVVLSGSPGLRPNLEQAAIGTAKAAEGDRAEQPSLLFKQAFESYNQGFEPLSSGYEWLSRDTQEVSKYVEDQWCGFPFTNRLVAEMARCSLEAGQPENLARIPKKLPIFLFAGTHDRVGGNGAYVEALAMAYRGVGLTDVQVKLYAEGRHEMLNEINRAEVHADLLAWLQQHS